jgi:ABC-2 type transport system ATP-binding protein
MDEIIRTEKIVKHYGRVRAVEEITLSVRRGEIDGFLGLNGAGKTTMIRMLLGMVGPTAGSAYIMGFRVTPAKTGVWKHVGFLVETPYSYPDLSVRENLEICRRLHFVRDSISVDKVIDQLKLGPYRERKARHLSTGNAQRLGLAKALLHNPEILILDEPTNGLDPSGIVEIRELLRELVRTGGKTVFISSHILGEIAKLATRIGIIHKGRMIQEVDTDKLDRYRHRRLLVNTRDPGAAAALLRKNGRGVTLLADGGMELTDVESLRQPEAVAELLVRQGSPPTRLLVEEENLESYFLRTIGMNGESK